MKHKPLPPGEETVRVLREGIARAPALLDAMPISEKERTYMKHYVQSLQDTIDRCDKLPAAEFRKQK